MRFRDRDAPVTPTGLIFRTYGYDHPPNSCFCDLEYASENVYQTDNPKALRDGLPTKYYKFYLDGGLTFAMGQDPPYQILHRPLNQMMVGVKEGQLAHVMRPEERLEELLKEDCDPLVQSAKEVVYLVIDSSRLRHQDLGVFGSLAHGFHNPRYSDIDLVVYGVEELKELRATLEGLYCEGQLRNEFEDWTLRDPPIHWNFTDYSKEEYGPYQMRKLIYAKYSSEGLGRDVNVEFEPVRKWDEINNEYETTESIEVLGRVEAIGEITSGDEGGFMPSIYPTELKKINTNIECDEVKRIVSYVKEFRLQLEAGETVLIKGNLEKVETRDGEFHQITLSYGPGYFDQVLRVIGASS